MNKNTLTAILMGFVICLGIVVIVLSVKLSIRPKAEPEPDLNTAANVFVEDNTNLTDTPTPTLEPTTVPEVTTITVQMVRATTSVNVRAEPSANGTKLGTVVKGAEFVMIEQVGEGDNQWTKIEYESGEAYIKSSYLESFEKEVEVTPTPATEGADGEPDAGGDPAQ